MRHKRIGRKLGVTTKHRKAMFRNMVTDFFRFDKIKTTDTRAKELRRIAEKLITLAKDASLHKRRQAAAYIRDNEVLKKLFDEIAPKFKDRPGGYTRITKLGFRRGDSSPVSIIELVEEDYKPKKKKAKAAPKKKETEATAKAKSSKKESAEDLGLIEEEKAAEASAAEAETTAAAEPEAQPEEAAAPETETTAAPEAETPAAEAAPEETAEAPEAPVEEATAPEAAAEPAEEAAPEAEDAPDEAPEAEGEDKKE